MGEQIIDHPGISFHGEIAVIRSEMLGIDELPKDAAEIRPEHDRHVIAHSESGHHHYIAASEARFYGTADPNICYLSVGDGAHAYLKHAKPESAPDRHGTQRLGAGLYRIHRQREETPEGWRRVAD